MKKFIIIFGLIFLLSVPGFSQTKSVMIPAMAFWPDHEAYYWEHSLYIRPFNGNMSYTAPLILPDGAKIFKMVVYYVDNDVGHISVSLYDYNLYTHTGSNKFSISTEGVEISKELRIITDEEGWVKIRTSGHQYYRPCVFSDVAYKYEVYAVKLLYRIN